MNPFDGDRRWLKRFGRRDETADVRLLCFHHAGGNAATYRRWPGMMPRSIQPIAVQLPGRADRLREPAYDRMTPLLDDLVEVIKPLLDRPFACYGVSLGARVAWALVHALRERAMPMPRSLFVAACQAPSLDDGVWEWEGREDGLEGYVRELGGGMPPEVLADPELVQDLLATLRADVAVLTTHSLRPEAPLDVPIHAFAGTDDPSATSQQMSAWRRETTARFDLDVVAGGHFFDRAGERQVIQAIGHDLADGADSRMNAWERAGE